MILITNSKTSNHRSTLLNLIEWADECILCTSFFDYPGLKIILPTMQTGINSRSLKVTIFSNDEKTSVNKNYTEKKVITTLKDLTHINHILIKKRRLHSKVYFFKNNDEFKVLIGSANLTKNGLTINEEFSTLLHGKVGCEDYLYFKQYFDDLHLLT